MTMTVFVILGGIGFVFLLVSLFLGEAFDFGHDLFGFDLDHGPSLFSLRSVAVFATVFGATGAAMIDEGFRPVSSTLAATASGFVAAYLAYGFAKFLFSQQSSSVLTAQDVIGKSGLVITAIPASGLGQVRCVVGETISDRIAKAANNISIPENTTVIIEAEQGEILVVKPGSTPVSST